MNLAATSPWSPDDTMLALCSNPCLLLLYKPTNSIDPASRCTVWELLRREAQGRAVLLDTHC